MTALRIRFDRWLLAPAPAERMAGLRIATGGFVLVYMLANVGEVSRLAGRPLTNFEPVGLASLLDEPASGVVVWLLYALQIISGIAFVAGARFRFAGPLFAGLTLWWASYHSSFGQMLHFEHLFTIHLMVLAFAPAAAAWSFDARRVRRPFVPSVAFGWPIRLMAICTAVTYLLAGVAKLQESGVSWTNGSTLENHIAYSATRVELLGGIEPPLAGLVLDHAWLLAPMAVVALAVELAAPVALLSARARNLWVASALLFHIGTAATMMVWFPFQGLGFAMLPLFQVERLVPVPRAVGQRARVRFTRRLRLSETPHPCSGV